MAQQGAFSVRNGDAARIVVVAPARRFPESSVDPVRVLAARHFGDAVEIVFHEQCFLSDGHFAGSDANRTDAFVEAANDASADALWFARGGYGACRIAPDAVDRLGPAARNKAYLGYSDAGFLLARLRARGIGEPAHGPMAYDISRSGGEAAVLRALRWLVARDPASLEASCRGGTPALAFNATVLAHALHHVPDLDFTGRVLMLEEVGEYLYAFDRAVGSILSSRAARRLAGVRLGRISDIPNDPGQTPFGRTESEIVRHWCARAGVPFLGTADIGHDTTNAVVPFI